MKVLALLLPFATALRLPAPHVGAAAAATALSSPVAAFAYENGHKLAPGTDYGDVALSYSNFGSAVLGFAFTGGAPYVHTIHIIIMFS